MKRVNKEVRAKIKEENLQLLLAIPQHLPLVHRWSKTDTSWIIATTIGRDEGRRQEAGRGGGQKKTGENRPIDTGKKLETVLVVEYWQIYDGVGTQYRSLCTPSERSCRAHAKKNERMTPNPRERRETKRNESGGKQHQPTSERASERANQRTNEMKQMESKVKVQGEETATLRRRIPGTSACAYTCTFSSFPKFCSFA